MINSQKAYNNCFRFLDEIWEMNATQYDDDFPALLGSMQLSTDGSPFDRALENDWKKATLMQEEMSMEFAFESIMRFLKIYIDLGEADTKDITRVLQYIESNRSGAFARWVELARKLDEEGKS